MFMDCFKNVIVGEVNYRQIEYYDDGYNYNCENYFCNWVGKFVGIK